MSRPDPRRPVSVADIAALTRRLRDLSDPDRRSSGAERAAFLADKHALLDRITSDDEHPLREETMTADDRSADNPFSSSAEPGAVLHRHNVFADRAADPGPVDGDDDGWVSGGYEAAHQAHLDYIAEGGDRAAGAGDDVALTAAAASGVPAAGADGRWWETEAAQARIGQWARETADPVKAATPGRPDRPEEIAARIQDIRDQLHAEALDEDAQRAHAGSPVEAGVEDIGAGTDAGDGWSR